MKYSRCLVVPAFLFLAITLVIVAATPASAAAADAMTACPVPDPEAIVGHEAVFYECAELHAEHGVGCGPDGYLLGYGARYARRFHGETRPRMTARGQQWIDDVLVCLQEELRASIDEATTCDDIGERAFATHPDCYVASGFCTLSPWDLLQVVWTIDARDWWSTGAAGQAVTTALACGGVLARTVRFFFWDHLV